MSRRPFGLFACKQCKRLMRPRAKEHPTNYEKRSFCDKKCQGQWITENGRSDNIKTARARRVLEYEPELELWAICERFGVDHRTARRWVDRFVGRELRPLLKRVAHD